MSHVPRLHTVIQICRMYELMRKRLPRLVSVEQLAEEIYDYLKKESRKNVNSKR